MLTTSLLRPAGFTVGLATIAFAAVAGLSAQEPATSVHPDNFYAAGNRIDITSPMGADVIVAGRTIDIAQPVAGDIAAAGWHLRLSAPAHDDLRMAGGDIAVDAAVGGDMTLAGGEITLGASTHVRGRTWMTANSIRTDGVFEREVQIAAATVHIAGELRQPVRVIAENLEILPGARLLAPLSYKGANAAVVHTGAELSSPIAFERINPREAQQARSVPGVSTFFFVVHLLLAGLIALYFVPKFEPSVIGTLRMQPVRSLLTGFVLLVTVPVAAALLVVTLFALPLGVALGMVYFMSLFVGVLAIAFFVGDFEARLFKMSPAVSSRQHGLLLLAGVLTLAVLRVVLGGVVVFVSTLFGVGALTLWLYESYSTSTVVKPAV